MTRFLCATTIYFIPPYCPLLTHHCELCVWTPRLCCRLLLLVLACCLSKQRPVITWPGLLKVLANTTSYPPLSEQRRVDDTEKGGPDKSDPVAYQSLMLELIGRVTRPQPRREVSFWWPEDSWSASGDRRTVGHWSASGDLRTVGHWSASGDLRTVGHWSSSGDLRTVGQLLPFGDLRTSIKIRFNFFFLTGRHN